MDAFLSISYFLGTFSVLIIVISYPQSWITYANRPIYEIINYSNYSTIVSVLAKENDCYRIMDPNVALQRLEFANEINTWLVLFFTVSDWILMIFCSLGALIIFCQSRNDDSSDRIKSDRIKSHILIEFLSLVSLLIISPLSYPALIDDYEDCLDNNPFMRYDVFIFIEISFFIVISFVAMQLVLFQNEEKFINKYGKVLFGKVFYLVRNLNILLLSGFFVISLVITVGTNSLFVLGSIVLDSGVGIYMIYVDAIKNKSISDMLPISPKSQVPG
jgi:hypothetical protein